jgi:3',5'-cyclic AMP phosphodiesterase CpdA
MTLTSSDTAKANCSTRQTPEGKGEANSFVVAHISDPHIARVEKIHGRDLLSKRLFGYLRWKLKRRFEQSYELLTILHTDLQRSNPDHIVITGDLTHLSLPAEFEKSRNWLQSMGTPEQVTVIPGNHDTYVKTAWHQSFALWLEYMQGDTNDLQTGSINSLEELYPTLRIRNRIAFVGINTAQPSAPHLATGTIGADQLKRLEIVLKQLNGQRLFRIILIHHPPISGVVNWRRGLTDAKLLQAMLERHGAELVLFGHAHKTARGNLVTPTGMIPVIGASAASSLEGSDDRRSRYYLYKIMPSKEGWNVLINERIFSLEQYRFIAGRQEEFFVSYGTR